MIIQFKVANYRSIGAEQTLSFVAESTRRHPDNLISRPGYKLLKTTALLGANASGKSNLVKAIQVMQEFVRDSATRMNEGDLISAAEPFRLDPELRIAPSRFEITFVTDSIVYVYGFAVRRKRVDSEWLTAKRETAGTKLFEFRREFNPVSEKYDWNFGGFKESDETQIKDRTLGNMLAFSVGTQQKVEVLRPAYSYLRERVWTFDMSSEIDKLGLQTAQICQDSEEMRLALSSLLCSADTGIESIHAEKAAADVPNAKLAAPNTLQQLVNEVAKDVARLFGLASTSHIIASRRDHDGNKVDFDFKADESQGTQRFFAVAGPILNALKNGSFVAIDELDASMHPLLTRRLLELFQSAEANSSGAQLLFTTHDSSLLDQDLFRRDQIWLAEKCDGASTFFSLADIKPPIRNTESFLRNYLTGRYGGTPHLGQAFDDLIAGVKA
ncbi:MAG: AAA family ATPase [Janthinobacterium lividum]